MSITNNGTAVSKKVTTTGIETFADENDNTMNPEPPLKPNVTAGPGKDQG
jgi:hypothetical protein